jgi:hypothetical protein
MKKLVILLLCSWQITVCVAQQLPTPGIAQIPVPGLGDICTATMDQAGNPIICYNPQLMQQVGPLAAYFFIAHEYGHHKLGHIVLGANSANNPYLQVWLTMNMENQADAFAVDYWISRGDKRPIQAGCNTFMAINNPGDQTHPPSALRAQNVAQYFAQRTGFALFP